MCFKLYTFQELLHEDGSQMPKHVQRIIHTEKSNKMQQCIKIYYSIFI